MFAKYHDDFILWIFYIFYILVYFFTFLYVNSYFYYSRRNGIYTDICFGFVTRILLYFAYFYIFYAHFDFCLSMNAWTPTGIVQLLGTIQSRSPNEFYTFWKKSIRFKVYTLMSFGVRGTFVILKDEKKRSIFDVDTFEKVSAVSGISAYKIYMQERRNKPTNIKREIKIVGLTGYASQMPHAFDIKDLFYNIVSNIMPCAIKKGISLYDQFQWNLHFVKLRWEYNI